MTVFTAEELIAHAKAYIAADAARMSVRPQGFPRVAWRMENPIELPSHWEVRDTAFKTRPARSFNFDLNGNVYDLWVWSLGVGHKLIDRIDLSAPEADDRLARYERI